MQYLIFVPLVIVIILIAWLAYLETRLKKFFRGSRGENLEKTLSTLLKLSEESNKKISVLENQTTEHAGHLKKCLQKTAVVRFNPFRDAGSDQSFSIAALDQEKNGLVVSSLYGREMNRVYAKPVKNGGSEYQLTDEEKEAIRRAN